MDKPANSIEILVTGEALADRYADRHVLGGAPYNLARHLAGLAKAVAAHEKLRVHFASRVGADALGHEVLEDAAFSGLPPEWIQRDPLYATGTVDVFAASGQAPRYRVSSPAAWDHIAPLVCAAEMDVMCFGSLALRAQNSRETILQSLAQAPAAKRFCDINLRDTGPGEEVLRELLRLTHWLKLSDEELPILAQRLSLPTEPTAFAKALHGQFPIEITLLTKGPQGAQIYGRNGHLIASAFSPGVRVIDTVGAGDAFSAAWLVCQLLGLDAQRALELACAYASRVCEFAGPMPDRALRSALFESFGRSFA